jgi:hypothetical protein
MVHAPVPPVGRSEVRTSDPSRAAQNELEGHDTVDMPVATPIAGAWATRLDFHALAPPVGRVEVMMLPALSPATQRDADGQEIACKSLYPDAGRLSGCQGGPALLGLFETTAQPIPLAAHKAGDAHDIPVSPYAAARCTRCQLERPFAGCAEAKIAPHGSAARHSLAEGHDT